MLSPGNGELFWVNKVFCNWSIQFCSLFQSFPRKEDVYQGVLRYLTREVGYRLSTMCVYMTFYMFTEPILNRNLILLFGCCWGFSWKDSLHTRRGAQSLQLLSPWQPACCSAPCISSCMEVHPHFLDKLEGPSVLGDLEQLHGAPTSQVPPPGASCTWWGASGSSYALVYLQLHLTFSRLVAIVAACGHGIVQSHGCCPSMAAWYPPTF